MCWNRPDDTAVMAFICGELLDATIIFVYYFAVGNDVFYCNLNEFLINHTIKYCFSLGPSDLQLLKVLVNWYDTHAKGFHYGLFLIQILRDDKSEIINKSRYVSVMDSFKIRLIYLKTKTYQRHKK